MSDLSRKTEIVSEDTASSYTHTFDSPNSTCRYYAYESKIKWLWIYPTWPVCDDFLDGRVTSSRWKGQTVGNWLFEDIVCCWGCLVEIITDNSSTYQAAVIRHDHAKAQICTFCLLNPAKLCKTNWITPAMLQSQRMLMTSNDLVNMCLPKCA